ncbi:putative fatty acyl-CoA reductase CG5065 isoform X2 [Tribolium madens]|uniref:putative fatty acyl-CoA reductase CG5065 isoform X2 n=1 Tax=Tribolium madens TaxID=41895 RepID=UPI001CF76713|nr:putative fatty acyl-CoA reductase CG5065 isoform X2 [Tribolium madens]
MSIVEYPDRISQIFSNKTILITGATSFLGKVLLEKILRSCPSVHKIYILLNDPNSTFKNLTNDPLFRQQEFQIFDKIVPILADISLPELDLSPNHREICENVEIIFHCAGIDSDFKYTILTNVRGTKLMLELAKKCQKLKIFTFISTAFCQLDEEILYEKVYQRRENPQKIIKICEILDDDMIELIKHKISGNFPNFYTFSKALSENLIADEINNIPVVIFRPSVVVPILREPLPGYSDINNPVGLLISVGKPLIRSFYCKNNAYLDCIPADIIANTLMFSVFDFITNNGQRRVYNAVSSNQHKIPFKQVVEIVQNLIETNLVWWYLGGSLITHSKIKHYVYVVLFQLLPAFIIDAILILFRQKPILVPIQKKVLQGYQLCEFYVNKTWNFDNSNTLKATENLNPKEREIYKMEVSISDNSKDYFTSCIHFARLYLLKETDEQMMAKKIMKIW